MSAYQQKLHDASRDARVLYMLRSLDDEERHQVAMYIRHLSRWYNAGVFTRKAIKRILALIHLS